MLTVYTTIPDITLLVTIFNGVAMICQQTVIIWGFALLAAFYHLFAGSIRAGVDSATGRAGQVASSSAISSIVPFVLAMVMTSPNFQSQITIESTYSGNISTVDNVPIAFSIIPATVTLFAYKFGVITETAFQATGTDYPSISASGNGFINPLKLLLASRSTVMRLNGIASDVNTLVDACLDPTAVNAALLKTKVNNAGNSGALGSGAAVAETIQIPSLGAVPTGIGALLYQASLNTTGMVTNLIPAGTANQNTIYNCTDAANVVAGNIDAAINSPDFARVIQGAVNTTDEALQGTNFSSGQFMTNFTAIRNASASATTAATSVAQANAEAMNFLFAEILQDNLNCIKTSSSDKATCMANMIQANELERNNLQAAANEGQMLKYAGQFANQIIALLIGLSPVLFLIMMLTGTGMDKGMKALAQAIFWPPLVISIGAEIINGMTYISVAKFFSSIAQAGYLSPSVTMEAYKEIALQVGTAAQLMSGLPLLVSTIFLLSSAQRFSPMFERMQRDTNTADTLQPQITNSAPLIKQDSAVGVQRTESGSSVINPTGSLSMVGMSQRTGDYAQKYTKDTTALQSLENQVSSGRTYASNISRSISNGAGHDYNLSDSYTKALHDNYSKIINTEVGKQNVNSIHNGNSTTTTSGGGVAAGGALGTGNQSGASISGSINTGVSAVNNEANDKSYQASNKTGEALAMMKAIDMTNSQSGSHGVSQQDRESAEKVRSKLENYVTQETSVQSLKDSTSLDSSASSDFVANTQSMDLNTFAYQSQNNDAFKRFQITEGRRFENDATAKSYIDKVAANSDNYSFITDPKAQQAAIRHQAAVQLEQDRNASPQARRAAMDYLTGEVNSITQGNVQSIDTSMKSLKLSGPEDRTNASGVKYDNIKVPALKGATGKVDQEGAKLRTIVTNGQQDVGINVNNNRDIIGNKTQGLSDDSTAIRAANKAVQNTKETVNAASEAAKPIINKIPTNNYNSTDEAGAGSNG